MSGAFERSVTDPNSCSSTLKSSFAASTGTPMSHPPPGGGSTSPNPEPINRPVGSYILPQPTHIRSHAGIAPPVWLSTSSRPIGSGSNLMSPGTSRVVSPPQPPPLPPPPPSPQLVPLKARLARSKSVVSQFGSSPVPSADRAQPRWDGSSAGARRAAFGKAGPTRSLREPLPSSDTDGLPTSSHADLDINKPIEPVALVPFTAAPGAFPPIIHPRERNAITVCLASFVFLTVSVLITTVFSTIILPLCLLACVVRRLGVWMARWFAQVICCQCNRPQLRSAHPIHALISRLTLTDPNSDQVCQCLRDTNQDLHYPSLRPLTPAELRWLPVFDSKQSQTDLLPNNLDLYSPANAPVIVICLRFGSPGLQLAKLREIISSRLLNRHSAASSLASSPRNSNLPQEKWFNATEQVRQRTNSLAPPSDTLSRLTQCLTCLSTGYAWRECLAFRIEEHVIQVPTSCLPPNPPRNKWGGPKLNRSSSSSEAFDPRATASAGGRDQQPQPINVEAIVQSVSQLPLLLNRPLWQAYLLEEFQEADTNEASDVDSVTETDEIDNSAKRNDRTPYLSAKSKPFNRGTEGKLSVGGASSSSTSFLCRRSGSAGVGSLLIFRLHAVLSDDGKALVHLLTNCLADLPSRTHSPKCTPTNLVIGGEGTVGDSKATGASENRKRRWRGQISDPEEERTKDCESNPVSDTNMCCVAKQHNANSKANKPTVPQRSYVTKLNSTDSPKSPARELQSSQSNAQPNKPTLTVSNSAASQDCQASLLPSPEEEDPEESEAAQWWYTFWSSSLATIATCCDLIRALVTGPAVILHKYFFTRADVGIWALRAGSVCEDPKPRPTRLPSVTTTATTTSDSLTQSELIGNRLVYKCALLSLVKLSRVRQVTKASYSEIILSLLAGGLRAYHQTVGLKHPPDLLAFLSVEVPVLPGCSIGSLQNGSVQPLNMQGCDVSPCTGITRLWSQQQRLRHQLTTGSVRRYQQHQQNAQQQADSLVETGLLGSDHRMVALSAPPTTVNTLCPGRHVLADICLPINTEGMLPRLWETRQRLIELNNSVDPLCLAWARTILYTLMPHPLAGWVEANCGSSAKASVSVTGVEVVSPFTGYSKDQESNQTYQMPPTRRLAYMSLLASKSAEARTLRRRLRQRLPRGASVYPPRLGTSFRALARHLTNANAGLVYIGGSPVVRIDTWMPSPRLASGLPPVELGPQTGDTESKWVVCRNLSVTFTTYAGQLSLTFSADRALDSDPNLDLILHAMRIQLRKMCRLLAGRHVPTPADRWLSQSSNIESRSPASSAVNLSPSLNPNLVLHQDSTPSASSTSSSPDISPHKTSATCKTVDSGQTKRMRPSPTTSHAGADRALQNKKSSIACPKRRTRPPSGREPKEGSLSSPITKSFNNNWSVTAYACQSNQPTEQLQDRLRWVQQKLTDSAAGTTPMRQRLTEQELATLRTEFCALLRELKQRCSLGSLGIPTEFGDIPSSVKTEEPLTTRVMNGRSAVTIKHSPVPSALELRRNKSDIFGAYGVERSTPTGRLSPSKTHPGLEYFVNQKSSSSLQGGDFDEDPDFYIDGFDEEEDDLEEEDLVVAVPETLVPQTEGSGTLPNLMIVPTTQAAQIGSPGLAKGLLPGRKNVDRKSAPDRRAQKQKRRRPSLGNLHNRRRQSRLSTDVASFDLIPNRRGSLGSTSGVSSTEGLLTKLIKPKRPSALFSGPSDPKKSRK